MYNDIRVECFVVIKWVDPWSILLCADIFPFFLFFFLFVNKEYLQYKSVFEVNFMDLYYDLLFIYAKVKQFSISLNFNCEGGENERIDHFITCLRDKFRDVWRLLRFDHWHGELFIYAGTPLLL